MSQKLCLEKCTLLGYYAASCGIFLPTYLHFTLQDGTNRLSQNAGKKLSLLTVELPQRVQFSSTSWQKPQIMQALPCLQQMSIFGLQLAVCLDHFTYSSPRSFPTSSSHLSQGLPMFLLPSFLLATL